MKNKSLPFIRSPLPEGVSLQVYNKKEEIVFKNNGKWLHPLLELGEFLETTTDSRDELCLHDKIAGLAAAALICRLGIKTCHIDLVSRLALERFKDNGVNCTYNEVVDRIACQTESILSSGMDNEQIFSIIAERAGRKS